MEKKIEILLSVMNLKNEKEYENLIRQNNIKGQVIAINQVENEKNIFNHTDGKHKIFSYKEKGASKSRNRLLEKANGDICIFADDDTKYVENYEEIIKKEFKNNPEADVIIFFVENKNLTREKNKKIGSKKINKLDIMKARTYEIALKMESIKKLNIKFDNNFGPAGIFNKGEETVWLYDLLKNGLKIYSVNKKIGFATNEKSTWFTGFNKKYLYDQGAIFYRLSSKMYKALILQYVIRKYFQYKENVSIYKAYKQMCLGAKECEEIYK